MAEKAKSTKTHKTIIHHGRKFFQRFFSDFLVLRSFVALTFFMISFVFFYPLSYHQDPWLKIIVLVYSIILFALIKGTIYEYLLKTSRLLITKEIRIYTPIVSINTFFGLIVPIFYFNVLLQSVMKVLASFQNYGTIFCTIRIGIVNFYWNNSIYWNVNQLLFWMIVITFIFFIFGGLAERVLQRK